MEIERKFIVDRKDFFKYIKDNPTCVVKNIEISQYYIPALDGTFRLRRTKNPDNSFSFIITLKKFVSDGVNEEIEVNIDSNTAYEMVNAIKDLKSIKKNRYTIMYENRLWEIDLFQNPDLSVAEIELYDIKETFRQPYFLREEVTGDYKFSNEYIARNLSN